MTEKQKKQVAVQHAVMAVMSKNRSVWQGISELKNKADQLDGNLQKIGEYETILMKDPGPLKEKKLNSRKALAEKVFPVASVLGVFAYDSGDRKLGKLVTVKFSELEKLKPELLVKYCVKIRKIAAALLDQKKEVVKEGKKSPGMVISDYGLTAGHVEKLQAAIEGCISDEADYEAIRQSRKKSKVKQGRTIRNNNLLLKKRLDKMMHLFRDSQKTFYNAYIKARIPATAPEVKPVAAKAKQPAAAKKPATTSRKAPAKKSAPAPEPTTPSKDAPDSSPE